MTHFEWHLTWEKQEKKNRLFTSTDMVGIRRSRGTNSRNVCCRSVWVAAPKLRWVQSSFGCIWWLLANFTQYHKMHRRKKRTKSWWMEVVKHFKKNWAEMILKICICTENSTGNTPTPHFPFFFFQKANTEQIQKQIMWHCVKSKQQNNGNNQHRQRLHRGSTVRVPRSFTAVQ